LLSVTDAVGLPLAGVHAGVDLAHFKPAAQIADLWPRPVLFVHVQSDQIIPFERGQALWESMPQPGYYFSNE
jgi:hypothetical protein